MIATTPLHEQGSAARLRRWPARRPDWPLLRLLACCALLAAIPFATAPGGIIADTKFELAVNPSGFLSSALRLWSPQQFGGLANQYVGYLFPMGPFFELLRLASLAGWVIQRLWLAALLIVAFGGAVRLAARMGTGTPLTRLAGGLAYALSPAALSILGQTSGEFLPMALMPWIIVPLTDMAPWVPNGRRGIVSRARAVARSAVAIGLCSGMNAASTIAVLVPCVIYILTRPGVRVKARMLAWWVAATVLVTLSWSIPLLLLSKYGTSIVPFTESAQVTSSTTSLLNVLRGTENWIGYQSTNGQPNRPLAFLLATSVVPAVLAGGLAALGIAGLVNRRIPERRFLLWSLLGGVVILTLGYTSSLGSPLQGPVTWVLNGVAAPFRNLWKFDPMVRLPLALGIAHLLATPLSIRSAAGRALAVRSQALLRGAAAACLASLAVPAMVVGLASPGAFGQVPSYWVAAADWLTAHAGNQAVLVEPGAAFGEYTWGSPMDDVLQGLTNVDWADRNLGVVGSVGNERLLDAIDQQFAAGNGSAALTQVLARMGVKYVLVRGDLDSSQLTGTSPARIQDAIADSPGLTLAARFGPDTADNAPGDTAAGVTAQYPAVEIFQVANAEAAAVVQPAAGTVRVTGAPESLLTLDSEGVLGDRPVLLNGDGAGQPVAGSVVTDSLRRRAVNFGQLRTGYSPTLTASDPVSTFLSTDDFTEPGWSADQAVAQYGGGIKDVTASSSASDITAFAGQWSTGTLPFSAFDGDYSTMWESGSYNGALGQWIQASFDSAIGFGTAGASSIQVAFVDSPILGPPVTRVTVTTAAGSVSDPVALTGDLQSLRVPAGPSDWLRITVTGLEPYSSTQALGTQVGISAVVVPGIIASRTIVAPPVPAGEVASVVLAKAQPYQASCMLTTASWACSPLLASPSEEQYGFDEGVVEPYPQQAELRGTAILVNDSFIGRFALAGRGQPWVTASSTYVAAPQDHAWNAFDGDPQTSWIAQPTDSRPSLYIDWQNPTTISRITIKRPAGAASPVQVLITGSNGQHRGVMLGSSGVVTFAPMTTNRLDLTFSTYQAPVQVTDVVVPGVSYIAPAPTINIACGFGPNLSVGGVTVPTSVSGSYADFLNGRPLHFTACQPVTLGTGETRVTEPANDLYDVQDVVLDTTGTGGATAQPQAPGSTAAPAAAAVASWTSSVREVRVDAASRSYLEVNENFNAGWQAVLGGRQLQPVRLDGWKQAWVLPAGSHGMVTLTYRPQPVYRDAVAGGLAALVACMVVASVPLAGRRRRRGRREPERPVPVPWPAGHGRRQGMPPRRRVAVRWLGAGCRFACLAAFGLLVGGYPGAVLLPAAAIAFGGWGRLAGWRAWLAGGLFVVASAVGAAGEHMVFSGDGGLLVTALSNAIPQVICLIVAGALAAALLAAAPEDDS